MTTKLNTDNGLQGQRTEGLLLTAVWRNGGFSASYDSFVVGSSAVLRLNFCAKNPPLRQAAKPMVCAMKLFSENNAFTQSIKTQIIEHSFPTSKIEKRTRIGLGNNAKENGADQLNYAFFINPTQ
jgi:hypothetical protein